MTGNVRIADAGNVNGPTPLRWRWPPPRVRCCSPGSIPQRDALTGTPGMVVCNTDDAKFQAVTTFAVR